MLYGMLRDFKLHRNARTGSLLFINTATNSHQWVVVHKCLRREIKVCNFLSKLLVHFQMDFSESSVDYIKLVLPFTLFFPLNL